MASPRFWFLFCVLIVLAIIEFGGSAFACGHKAPVRAKAANKAHNKAHIAPKPLIKPVIKLGKPYLAELRRLTVKK